MIVIAIKSFFLSKTDSYSLGKPHMFHFSLSFYGEMITVICAILIVAIKVLKMHLSNLNLLLGKSAIWFEPSAQKRVTGKQTTSALYSQY